MTVINDSHYWVVLLRNGYELGLPRRLRLLAMTLFAFQGAFELTQETAFIAGFDEVGFVFANLAAHFFLGTVDSC